MKSDPGFPAVVQLADRQLIAYNAADLETFCSCYSDDVVVLDADGAVTMQGMQTFRERYAGLFEQFEDVRAVIVGRVHVGAHVVEHELATRRHRESGEESHFELLVRYTERDGRIATVQFLR